MTVFDAGNSIALAARICDELANFDQPPRYPHLAVPDKAAELGAFTSTQLSAMGRYVELLSKFTLEKVAAPVLFVQAGELIDSASTENWQATWESAHTVGTHFTIAHQNAGTTAQAIESWLETVILDEQY